MNRVLVLRLTGKANQVFPLLKALAKERGHLTLGQLIKERRC